MWQFCNFNSQPDDMDVEINIEDSVESDSEEDATIPSTTEYSYRNTLKSYLPLNSFDNLDMLLYFLSNITCPFPLKSELAKLSEIGYRENLNQRQLCYRVNKAIAKIRITESTLKLLLKYWLGLLIKHRYIEVLFTEASVVIDLEYLPKSFIVSREASLIAEELVTSRPKVKESTKKTGIDFVVSVAKRCYLSTQNHCEITILANATSCHFYFAKKVLQAIQSGDEQSLYTRNTKYIAIKATHWPEEISKFVLNEANSRSVPGKE